VGKERNPDKKSSATDASWLSDHIGRGLRKEKKLGKKKSAVREYAATYLQEKGRAEERA